MANSPPCPFLDAVDELYAYKNALPIIRVKSIPERRQCLRDSIRRLEVMIADQEQRNPEAPSSSLRISIQTIERIRETLICLESSWPLLWM